MIIKEAGCNQFAGLRNFKQKFHEGMNIVYGENEAGKSTLVNLIYRILFQRVNVGEREEIDTSFRKLFFPSDVLEGVKGDFVDGTLSFVTESGEYTLEKTWQKTGACKLITQTGSIMSEKTINEFLAKEDMLQYGKGIYDSIIFLNQKNSNRVLQALFDEKIEKKGNTFQKEMYEKMSHAIAELDGVSMDQVMERIDQEIQAYVYRWDEEADRPEKGRDIDQPWTRLGESTAHILKAYYEKRTLEKQLENMEQREMSLERERERCKQLEKELALVSKNYEELNQNIHKLKEHQSLITERASYEMTKEKMQKDLKKWPVLNEQLTQGSKLRQEYLDAEVRKQYQKMEQIICERNSCLQAIKEMGEIEEDHILQLKQWQREWDKCDRSLQGMDISAKLKLVHEREAYLVTADGERIDMDQENFQITQAASLVIPDVLELQLAPAGVDLQQIQQKKDKIFSKIKSVYERYQICSVEELEEKNAKLRQVKAQLALIQQKMEHLLADSTEEEIRESFEAVCESPRDMDVIQEDIDVLCQGTSLEMSLGRWQMTVDLYKKEYETMELLQKKICEIDCQIENIDKRLREIGQIPQEYQRIHNPENEMEHRAGRVRDAEDSYEKSKMLVLSMSLELEQYEYSAEELRDLLEEKQSDFLQKKQMLAHWKHIKSVMEQLMGEIDCGPMEGIQNNFQSYLTVLSEKGITLRSMNEKWKSDIYSRNNKMNMDLLSEGTKAAVSLAFRLAVANDLYPEGGGLLVLDDPFSDMDDKRKKQACCLVEEFARKNQVIFVTCDKAYMKEFENANVIYM